MKKLVLFFAVMLMSVSLFAHGAETGDPGILTGFASFVGLVTVVVPTFIGFLSAKLARPMNKYVTYWVTAVVGVAVTFFSWWAGLGFPAADASIWTVVINALFVAIASTGIVSVGTSEWMANLFGKKQ